MGTCQRRWYVHPQNDDSYDTKFAHHVLSDRRRDTLTNKITSTNGTAIPPASNGADTSTGPYKQPLVGSGILSSENGDGSTLREVAGNHIT